MAHYHNTVDISAKLVQIFQCISTAYRHYRLETQKISHAGDRDVKLKYLGHECGTLVGYGFCKVRWKYLCIAKLNLRQKSEYGLDQNIWFMCATHCHAILLIYRLLKCLHAKKVIDGYDIKNNVVKLWLCHVVPTNRLWWTFLQNCFKILGCMTNYDTKLRTDRRTDDVQTYWLTNRTAETYSPQPVTSI